MTAENRRGPMTKDEFDDFIEATNKAAKPGVPWPLCAVCGWGILEKGTIDTTFDPPRWYHLECDPDVEK